MSYYRSNKVDKGGWRMTDAGNRSRDMALVALFAALVAVGAFIRIPVPVVPFTLQFLFTNLAGLLLGAKRGAAAAGVYMAAGLIGVPGIHAGRRPVVRAEPDLRLPRRLCGGRVVRWENLAAARAQELSSSSRRELREHRGSLPFRHSLLLVRRVVLRRLARRRVRAFALRRRARRAGRYCALLRIGGARGENSPTHRRRRSVMKIEELKEKILSGGSVTREEALALESADVRRAFARRRRNTPSLRWRGLRRMHDNQREERTLHGKLQILRAVGGLPLRREGIFADKRGRSAARGAIQRGTRHRARRAGHLRQKARRGRGRQGLRDLRGSARKMRHQPLRLARPARLR